LVGRPDGACPFLRRILPLLLDTCRVASSGRLPVRSVPRGSQARICWPLGVRAAPGGIGAIFNAPRGCSTMLRRPPCRPLTAWQPR
jgi:hypothetical protein